MKLGVVDVGGGMRGIYATAVLDFCLDNGIAFDCGIGVSAGSANIASFLAGQRGRNIKFYTEYAQRSEYMSPKNFVKTGSYIDVDYVYGTLSNTGGEYPVDYDTLISNPAEFIIVATYAKNGEPKYFRKAGMERDHYEALMASCSLPVVNKPYVIDGVEYFDGGIADPVPLDKAFEEGCDKVLLLLTKPVDTETTKNRNAAAAQLLKHKYPEFAKRLADRDMRYARSVKKALMLEETGRTCVIAPKSLDGASTLNTDVNVLNAMYEKGYKDAEKILNWI